MTTESARPGALGQPSPQTPEERILASVHLQVGAERYARFFDQQATLALGPDHLDVTVPSGFAAQMLDRRFGDILRRAASDAAGLPPSARIGLRFRVDGGAFRAGRSASGRAPAETTRPAAPKRDRAPTRPSREAIRHRLEDFVVGDSNRMAFAAAEEFCRAGAAARHPPLFIHGRCGMGKTHLIQGIAARRRGAAPGAVRYTTAEAFTNEFIAAVKANRIDAFRRGYRAVETLCIDDVHFLSAKTGTQNELLHTFDALDLGGARVVLASDEHPRAIQRLSDSLASRFMAGLVVRLDPPDAGLCERIVLGIAARRGLAIDQGGARAIAGWGGGGSVRDLEGLVTRVGAVARLLAGGSEPLVLDSAGARRALSIAAGPDRGGSDRPRKPIKVDAIVAEVCRTLSVDHADLCGRGRHSRVVIARSLAAYLSRRLTTMSYPEIARAMGRPNHSSVITAFERVRRQIAADMALGPEDGNIPLAELSRQIEDRLVRSAPPA